MSKIVKRDNTTEPTWAIEKNRVMKVLRKRLSDGNKQISKIVNRNGQFTTNKQGILNIVRDVYKELYRNNRTLNNIKIPDITLDKIQNSLKNMKNNNSPGTVGISA